MLFRPSLIKDPNSRYTRYLKPLYQSLRYSQGVLCPIFVLGAQNSGANQLATLFQKQPSCRVYSEIGQLSCLDKKHNLRMNPFWFVKTALMNIRAPLSLALPLVESHRAIELLNDIQSSHVIWLYRHFVEFAVLDLHYFKKTAGVGNLLPILNDDPQDWRNEGVSTSIRETIRAVHKEVHSPFESACLFWYARNRLAFEQRLDSNTRVTFLSHAQLKNQGNNTINRLMQKFNLPMRGHDKAKSIFHNDASLLAKQKQKLDPNILALCEHLYKKLNNTPNNIRYVSRDVTRADGFSELRRVATSVTLNSLSHHVNSKNLKPPRQV